MIVKSKHAGLFVHSEWRRKNYHVLDTVIDIAN
jgi:hypothetical protein